MINCFSPMFSFPLVLSMSDFGTLSGAGKLLGAREEAEPDQKRQRTFSRSSFAVGSQEGRLAERLPGESESS